MSSRSTPLFKSRSPSIPSLLDPTPPGTPRTPRQPHFDQESIGTPKEMVLDEIPNSAKEIADWMLKHFKDTHLKTASKDDLLEWIHLITLEGYPAELPYLQTDPTVVVGLFGFLRLIEGVNGCLEFLSLVRFLQAYALENGATYEDYLLFRTFLPHYKEALVSAFQSTPRKRNPLTVPRGSAIPPKYRKVSPVVETEYAEEPPSSVSMSYKTAPPTILPNLRPFAGMPKPSFEEKEEELSQSSGYEEYCRMRDEEDMEMIMEQEGYNRSRAPVAAGTPSVGSSHCRRTRNERHKRYQQAAKTRSNVSCDKMQWDGSCTTFPTFANDLEGNMLRIGIGYMLDADVVKAYQEDGLDYIQTDRFWEEHGISVNQFTYDTKYLYGMLQSATKKIVNPHLVHHKKNKDGLMVWIKFQKSYAHGGSKTMKSDDLEDKVINRYDPRAFKGVGDYIDKFQTWMEELDALGTRSYSNADKKRYLLRNLKSDINLLSLIQTCEDDQLKDFQKTADYLREKGMSLDRTLKQSTGRTSKMLHSTLELVQPGPDYDECERVLQTLVQETSLTRAYNALQSAVVRKSLNIPNEIWRELEPKMKEKITQIKNEIRQKRQQEERTPSATPARPPSPLPEQYPTAANAVNTMLSNLCIDDTSDSEPTSTDDEALSAQYHTVMERDLEVRAHLELIDSYSKGYYAIADGGADSCVLGQNAEVVSYTGRFATLVGYDPKFTKSKRIPIVTAYLKVKAHNNIPVLLKINEAVYNEGSPVTLLSEYQVREYGFVIDSVAEKHLKSPDVYGTQRLTLNEDVHIPFLDRGGIMGFEILPVEEGDIDEVDPKFDIFEITGPKRWTPARFRSVNHGKVSKDAPVKDEYPNSILKGSTKPQTLGETLDSLITSESQFGPYNVHLEDKPGWIPQVSFALAAQKKPYKAHVKTWKRTHHPDVDPETFRQYLGWRPLEIVKKTLEHTTQLAKTSITYPLQRHFKARNPFANVHRLNEVVSTDPIFANCRSIDNCFTGAQVFFGLRSHCIDVYGLKSKGEFPRIYKDFIREQGAPSILRRDNAGEEKGIDVQEVQRSLYPYFFPYMPKWAYKT